MLPGGKAQRSSRAELLSCARARRTPARLTRPCEMPMRSVVSRVSGGSAHVVDLRAMSGGAYWLKSSDACFAAAACVLWRRGVRAIGLASEKHRRLKFPRHAGHLRARTRVWSTESKKWSSRRARTRRLRVDSGRFLQLQVRAPKNGRRASCPQDPWRLRERARRLWEGTVKKNAGFPQCRSGLVWVLGSGGYTSG